MLLAWFVWSLEEEAERLGGAGKDNGDTALWSNSGGQAGLISKIII